MTNAIILSSKLEQEYQTIKAMVQIYCKDIHNADNVCKECIEFLQYARNRLDRCPYGETKPTCNNCTIHCYKPEQKQQAKTIMKYAGPRMLWHHPVLAIKHLLNERKKIEGKPIEGLSNRHQRLKSQKKSKKVD